jgi:hypothetical protein
MVLDTENGARARSAITQRLRSLRGDEIFRKDRSGYTKLPGDNLIPGVTVSDFWEDLSLGKGGELCDSPTSPAKLCAAYSSSALAVNTFGPFRHFPERLVLAGYENFRESQFERKCPTGLRGTPPHLDFFVSGPEALVAIESKFLETLQPKKASFKASYDCVMQANSEPLWQRLYLNLVNDPAKFAYLDAAQLIKHYLGMRNTFRRCTTTQILLYLFWEPLNAADIPEVSEHRRELELFAGEVQQSTVRFVAFSYSQLLQAWSIASAWAGMSTHIKELERRYKISI